MSRARRTLTAVAVASLAVTGVSVPAPTATAQPSGCVDTLPVPDLQEGMTGVGYTTEQGSDPEPFDVEVRGVLTNGIAPGIDLIVVHVSGQVIDDAGGIWFGMSGSPVYIDGKLVGAVGYGFSATSRLAGLTPAQAMLDVHAMSPDEQAQMTAQRSFAPQASSFGTYRPLRVPLGVSGLRPERFQRIQERADGAGLPVVLHPSASAPAPAVTGAQTPPTAGGNFVGVLSYGDLTLGATGTTTYVCDGRAVAFGHPFTFRGEVSYGANDGVSLGIVEDLVFGPYKLVQPTNTLGILDQDRLAGVRAVLGGLADLVPVTSEVRSAETGRVRQGRTDVTESDFVPDVAVLHLLTNLDATVDRIGPGESAVSWTVTGTSPDTGTWTLHRDNLYASQFDVTFDSILELLFQLAAVQANPFSEVTFTSVAIAAEVRPDFRQLNLSRVLVRTPEGGYEPVDEVVAAPGSQLDLRVELEPYRGTDTVQVDLTLDVPEDTAGGFGFLDITGGGLSGEDPFECLFDPQACSAQGRDLPSLLERLENAPRNDDLVARLYVDPFPDFEEPFFAAASTGASAQQVDEPGLEPTAEQRVRLDRVVSGILSLPASVTGDGFDDGSVDRVSGPTRVHTAIAVSEYTYPEGASAVVLARADGHADALAGAPLAAQLGAPVLLTSRAGLDAEVAEEIQRLGADTAVLLGGTGALSARVVADLETLGVADVQRVAGVNRFDTARRIAARLGPGDEVIIVKGAGRDDSRAWPDAVSASGYAAYVGAPILLVEAGRLPAETSAALDAANAQLATIVGGEGAVSAKVARAVDARVRGVRRAGGETRFDTSQVMAVLTAEAGADPFRTFVATGANYPDALAAGPAAAAAGGVLLLVPGSDLQSTRAAVDWLTSIVGGSVTIVGGVNAVSEFVEQQIFDLLAGGGG